VFAAAPTAATRGEQEDKGELLTTARVEAWCAAAAAGTSLGAAAKVLRGFRACAHYGDAVGDEDQSGEQPPLAPLLLPSLTPASHCQGPRAVFSCGSHPAPPSTDW